MDAMREKVYTYEDYCKINDNRRYEVINGVAYLMTSPSREHEDVSMNLGNAFYNYLKSKKCKVYASFDVRLPKEDETKATASTIVQPDIFVVCDKTKLDRRGCFGAPDLVIEILSPSTGKRDKVEKFNLYQKHGVREYWIIEPFNQTIDRFTLDTDTGKYKPAECFDRNDTITPAIFPDFTIKLEEVFPPLDEYEDE